MNKLSEYIKVNAFELPQELLWIWDDILSFPLTFEKWLRDHPNFMEIYSAVNGGKIKNSIVMQKTFIGDFSLIRNSIVYPGARIGAFVEIANSIILNDCVIPHHNYVGYSILGQGVQLGGNTRTTVRRMDNFQPRVEYSEGQYWESKSEKFGALIGENAKIGSCVVFSPLTIIGKGTLVDPCTMISGIFRSQSRIKNIQIIRGNEDF